jgi:hypothetical protein
MLSFVISIKVMPNKGNQLFAERQRKSEEWIVADVVVDAANDKLMRSSRVDHELFDFGFNYSLNELSQKREEIYPKYKDFNRKAKPFVKTIEANPPFSHSFNV